MKTMTRREFGTITGSAVTSFVAGACRQTEAADPAHAGRLTARPRANATTSATSGRLGLERDRDAVLRLPPAASGPLPLLVMLHGASGNGEGVLRRVADAADRTGVAVVAPDSRGPTWDGIREGFGRDVAFINRVLDRVFETVAVDLDRVAIGGFSDGASYALSLGLVNGDLFSRVVAFSPGFVVPGDAHGKARFFISHGISDHILPIDRCSRVIVPGLQRRGLDVTYHEFEGRHEVPPAVALEALRWMVGAD